MNNGFFGFSNIFDTTNIIEIKEFDQSGSYLIPNSAKRIKILVVGSGAGGGGGARKATGTASGGGGGGAGGPINIFNFWVDQLYGGGNTQTNPNTGVSGTSNITLSVVIGAGGTGGPGGANDGDNGTAGSIGGGSFVSIPGSSGYLMKSIQSGASAAGQGGTTSAGSGGGSTPYPFFGLPTASNLGGGASGSNTISTAGGIANSDFGQNGGAGGGGVSSTNTASNGGSQTAVATGTVTSIVNSEFVRNTTIVSGTSANSASKPVSSFGFSILGQYSRGLGAAGGGGGATANGSDGGDGWRGGGGGGGGGCRNGFTAGNGGNGGNGYIVIIAYG